MNSCFIIISIHGVLLLDMDLLQSMRVFAKLAEFGSFTKTADAFRIGRPQVTLIIRELEQSIGVRLFQRTTRKVSLTSEGQAFLERVQVILSNVSEATAMFEKGGGTLRGRLRIDIPTAFSQEAFIQALREFQSTYPGIELTLGVTDRIIDLVAEGVDCVVRIGDLQSSSLVARRIGFVTMVTCASPSYLESHGAPKALPDLAAHQCVNFLSGISKRALPWNFLDQGREEVFSGRSGILVNDSSAYIQCGLAGFGIIQVPGLTVDQHLTEGRLVEVLAAFRPRPRPVSVVYPSKIHLAPQVQVFADWVRQTFASLSPWVVDPISSK